MGLFNNKFKSILTGKSMGNDYVERESKSNIDINERRRLLRTKQSNEMNRLRQRQQQQIHQLIQKHRDQSTELERQISNEAHWIRCEIQKPHNSIAAVNRSEWRVEKWSGWRESNPIPNFKTNESKSETVGILMHLPFLNEYHKVLMIVFASISFPCAINSSAVLAPCLRSWSAIS